MQGLGVRPKVLGMVLRVILTCIRCNKEKPADQHLFCEDCAKAIEKSLSVKGTAAS